MNKVFLSLEISISTETVHNPIIKTTKHKG